MNIAFTFKNFEASDHLKKYARRRMEKMGRFFGKASGLEVGVVLTVDKFRHRCEVTIAGEGLHLSASEQSSDMYAAIDVAAAKVLRQLRKYKTRVIDRKVRAEMQYEIRNLQRQIGTTTVFVTHDQEEALTMSDQIILLHDGQIEQQGDPFTIYSQPASVFASDFLGKANLLSGVLACEDGVWCVCSENVRIPVNHVGGREGDTVKTAVRGEYFEFCTPEMEGANPFHLEKKIFTGLSWKLIGTLGTQPLDISALGTHAGTLSEGDDLFVRIRPENVVYYNNN